MNTPDNVEFTDANKALVLANSNLSAAELNDILAEGPLSKCRKAVASLLAALLNCLGGHKPKTPTPPTSG